MRRRGERKKDGEWKAKKGDCLEEMFFFLFMIEK